MATIPGLAGLLTIPSTIGSVNQNSELPDNSTDIGGIAGSLAGLAGGALLGGLGGKKLAAVLGKMGSKAATKELAIYNPKTAKGLSGLLGKLRAGGSGVGGAIGNYARTNSKSFAGLGAGLGALMGAQSLGGTIHQQNAVNSMQQMALSNQLQARQDALDLQSLPARQVSY